MVLEAKGAVTTGTIQQETATASFRNVALWVFGYPREIAVAWLSLDVKGKIHEEAHLRIAPITEMSPATADRLALFRRAVDDATESLSLGIVRPPSRLPQFPVIPAKLESADLAKLSSDEHAARRNNERAALEQGVKYLMAIADLLHMPDAQVLDVTKGSESNLPVETLHISPTEIRATVGIGKFDTRTIRAHILGDGSIDLSLTDTIDFKSTQKGGIEALTEAREVVKSFFPGLFATEELQEPGP